VSAPLASIVVLAFDRDPEGNLVPAFDLHAKVIALDLRRRHAGVIALKHRVDLDGRARSEILALYGDAPDEAPLHFRNRYSGS
jgi:hypothetical protein